MIAHKINTFPLAQNRQKNRNQNQKPKPSKQMPSINEVYKSGGDYLKASDLQGRRIPLTIGGVDVAEFDRDDGSKEHKLVLSFAGREKRLVLNKTNAATIAELHGDDYGGWVGKDVQIYPTRVSYGEKMVDAIRVYMPEPDMAELEDDVPF